MSAVLSSPPLQVISTAVITRQPKGRSLALWWADGLPGDGTPALIAEGEGDTLAARSALARSPVAPMRHWKVACVPGTGMPIERAVAEHQLHRGSLRRPCVAGSKESQPKTGLPPVLATP
jgi:hypothetical protein